MALTFNLQKIPNYEEKCYRPVEGEEGKMELKGVTHGLIFLTMAIGMGSITKVNLHEFTNRVMILQRVRGEWLHFWEDGEKVRVYITPEDIRMHVGMTTNASRMTRVQFRKRVFEILDESARSLEEELREHDKSVMAMEDGAPA